MKAQESQVKELLQWNAKSPNQHTSIVYTQTYPASGMNNSMQHSHSTQQLGGGYQQSRDSRESRGNPILQGGNMGQGNNQMYASSNQSYGGQVRNNMHMQGQQEYQSNHNNRGQRQQAPANDPRGGRANVTFPSFQRVEDNKDEIKRTDYELARLTQHRKILENELFKMPSTAKSLDQKRKKAALELELEGIDFQIEDCKNKLRKYDVLTVKN